MMKEYVQKNILKDLLMKLKLLKMGIHYIEGEHQKMVEIQL